MKTENIPNGMRRKRTLNIPDFDLPVFKPKYLKGPATGLVHTRLKNIKGSVLGTVHTRRKTYG